MKYQKQELNQYVWFWWLRSSSPLCGDIVGNVSADGGVQWLTHYANKLGISIICLI